MSSEKFIEGNDFVFIATSIQRMHLGKDAHGTVETVMSCDVPEVNQRLQEDEQYHAQCFLIATAAGVAAILGNRNTFNNEDAEEKLYYFMDKVKEFIEGSTSATPVKNSALDQKTNQQLESSIENHLNRKLEAVKNAPPPAPYAESRISRIMHRLPSSCWRVWPFKNLVVKHVANPWIKFAKTRQMHNWPEIGASISEEMMKLIDEDEQNEKLTPSKGMKPYNLSRTGRFILRRLPITQFSWWPLNKIYNHYVWNPIQQFAKDNPIPQEVIDSIKKGVRDRKDLND